MAQPVSNHIKIGSSEKLSLSKGNLTIGVKGTTEYGPTSDSGFYNGVVIPNGGYAIYVEKASQGPSIHVPANDTECMLYLKKYGAPDGTIEDMLSWSLTQNNLLVLKSQLTNSLQTNPFQNVSGTNDATGFFFGGFRGEGLLDLVKVGFLANGTDVVNAPVTAIDRDNQSITISGAQFVSGDFYTFSLDTNTSEPTPTPTPQPTSTPTPTPSSYTIGQAALGGTIAYILQDGDPGYDSDVQHGLVATVNDLSDAEWGCQGTTISGADGTALGTGNQNTIDIMADCATAGIAARLCGDLVEGGYSDWYLPSLDELNQLYINQIAIGNFAASTYWSSSESGASTAWTQNLYNGNQSSFTFKSDSRRVRAIRSF